MTRGVMLSQCGAGGTACPWSSEARLHHETRPQKLELRSTEGRRNRLPHTRGVTLLEMLIVIAIIGTIVAISFPSLTSGLAGVRLASASSQVASFLTSSMNTVERHEQPAVIMVSPKENRLDVFTAASGEKPSGTYLPPSGISFEGDEPHRYLLFPGGAFPRISLVLRNDRGSRRSVEIDPITAVPQVRRIEDAQR